MLGILWRTTLQGSRGTFAEKKITLVPHQELLDTVNGRQNDRNIRNPIETFGFIIDYL
jgi:hypothetical protein